MSLEIKFIISCSDSDTDKSESKLPRSFFCNIRCITSKRSLRKFSGSIRRIKNHIHTIHQSKVTDPNVKMTWKKKLSGVVL